MNQDTREFEIQVAATPDQVWEALIDPQQTRQFWHGALNHSSWQPGAPWTSESDTGELYLDGQVIAVERPHRMVHTMHFLQDPVAVAEPPTLVEISLEAVDGGTRLRLVNSNLGPAALENVSGAGGWKHILAGMKAMLEGGAPLDQSMESKMPVESAT
jgi:uncharacterized protein YndB with AHSA1/START domain